MASNLLHIRCPELFIELHPTANSNVDLKTVTYGSAAKLWWICKTCGDFYQASPNARSRGTGHAKCSHARAGKMKAKTSAKFIEEAVGVHGQKYGYEKVVYVNSQTKVSIACRTCLTLFDQIPAAHLKGYGCAKCAHAARAHPLRTTEEFVADARKVHGDTFGYTKTTFMGSRNYVTITCKTCGDFEQLAHSHLIGRGCQKCSAVARGLERRKTTEEFVAEAQQVHGDLYDYSKTEYKFTHEKVVIGCRICHEDFEQAPGHHLQGQGCPVCGRIRAQLAIAYTTATYITVARQVHGDQRYDYTRVNYTNGRQRITIGCCECLQWFEQIASNHLHGAGCKKCVFKAMGDDRRYTTEEFVAKAKDVYEPGRYDYSKTVYTDFNTHVSIHCNTCKTDFKQHPGSHLKGHDGCPICHSKKRESKGASNCRRYLTENKVVLEGEVSLELLPRYRYDFRFSYANKWYLLEFDGAQHFTFTPFWHSSFDEFLMRQDIDRIKTQVALAYGYTLIRLSNSDYEHIGRTLHAILTSTSNSKFVVDDLERYKFLSASST